MEGKLFNGESQIIIYIFAWILQEIITGHNIKYTCVTYQCN